MEAVRCPNCDRSTAVPGGLSNGREGFASAFVPRNSRSFRQAEGVGISGLLHACASCGLIWSNLDPVRLRDFIEAHGTELARQQLDEFDRGPYRDLPDTGLAREVGDQVAEIDALARGEGPGTVRRYRELRGVSWDRAIKETNDWERLTREEKLARFGWESKKAIVDDLDAIFP